jgi:hypothetical protein
MRWPLYLTVNVCLVALVGAGALGLLRQDAAAQAAQSAALDRGLDGLIAAWSAGATPPAGRVLRLFVTSEPDETWFAPPEPRPFWWPLLSRLSRSKAKAEHDRRAAELFGRAAFCDWHGQGLAWAAQRTARLHALSGYIAKARAARARIVLVADGRQAASAWDAVLEAGSQSSAPAQDRMLVEKFIALGAPAPGPPQSPLVRERLSLWHSEGSSVEPAGNQLEFMDAQGRVVRQVLSGGAAKEPGAVALLRGMIASDVGLAESLIRAGQLPASFLSAGQASAAAPPPGPQSLPNAPPAEPEAARVAPAAAPPLGEAPASGTVADGPTQQSVPPSLARNPLPLPGMLGGWHLDPPKGFQLDFRSDDESHYVWRRGWDDDGSQSISRRTQHLVEIEAEELSAHTLMGESCAYQNARTCVTYEKVQASASDEYSRLEGRISQGAQNGVKAYSYHSRLSASPAWASYDTVLFVGDRVLKVVFRADSPEDRDKILSTFLAVVSSVRPPRPG